MSISSYNYALIAATINYKTIATPEITKNGICGEAVTWTIDSNGVMNICGTGAMYDYYSDNRPWKEYQLAITKVIVEEGVTRIGNYAFYNCSNLHTVEMADSVETIGDFSFEGCTSIEVLTVGNGVTSINYGAFYGCSALQTAKLGNKVTTIETYAFYECKNLTEITLPFALQTIQSSAFSGCSSLKTVNYLYTEIWWKEVSIGGYNDPIKNATVNFKTISPAQIAYSGSCGEAVNWSIDSNGLLKISGIGGMYHYNSSNRPWESYKLAITKVVIEEGVTRIGEYAFANFNNLLAANMANSITQISSYAFYNCDALTDIAVGDNVESIQSYAFADCDALEKVTIPETVTSIANSVFSDSNAVIIVCDAESYVEQYAIANNIPYEYYFETGATLAVELYNPAGDQIDSGYTVRWYVGDTLTGIGNTLYNVDETTTYQYEIVLDNELGKIYVQPAKTTVKNTDTDSVKVTLVPFATVEVSGIVLGENNAPLSNAEVTFKQLLNRWSRWIYC